MYGCCGSGEELVHRRLLDLPAGVHDEHAVGDVGDDAEVVRDQDDRRPEPLADVAHQVEDPRLDRHVERGRRLVGDQDLRVAGERHRDHHALAHAAGELVRVLVDAPLRRRDADEVEQLDRALRAPRARDSPRCRRSTSRDLVADREDRVERRHRLLEDERDLAPADAAQMRVAGAASRSTPVEAARAARRRASRGSSREQRHRGDALAAARLADDAEHLARREREREPVDGVHGAVVGLEAHREVADVEQRLIAVVRGSRTSRRPSPSRLNESEQKKIARPGKTASRGACETYDCASESITPHDGVGGWTPRPRNDSTASPMIAAGIVTVACTSSVEDMFGRTCRARIDGVARAVRDRGAHVVLLAQRQRLAARDADQPGHRARCRARSSRSSATARGSPRGRPRGSGTGTRAARR